MKYIQSVQRAFDVLEFISDRPDEPRALGEIARGTGLRPATCSHLVNTMAERGYLQQAGARQGYQLGPMAYYLVRNGSFRRDLVERAEPLIREAAESLREWVVLAAQAGTRRLVLLEISGARGNVQLDRQAVKLAEKAYDAASTWLFLADMEPDGRAQFVECHGLPPGCENLTALDGLLERVKQEGHSVYEDPAGEVVKVAYPVIEKGVVTAAVGVYLPAFRFRDEHRLRILEEAARVARELRRR